MLVFWYRNGRPRKNGSEEIMDVSEPPPPTHPGQSSLNSNAARSASGRPRAKRAQRGVPGLGLPVNLQVQSEYLFCRVSEHDQVGCGRGMHRSVYFNSPWLILGRWGSAEPAGSSRSAGACCSRGTCPTASTRARTSRGHRRAASVVWIPTAGRQVPGSVDKNYFFSYVSFPGSKIRQAERYKTNNEREGGIKQTMRG